MISTFNKLVNPDTLQNNINKILNSFTASGTDSCVILDSLSKENQFTQNYRPGASFVASKSIKYLLSE